MFILTIIYSRVLLASIQSLTTCLCPRCCTKKVQVKDLGTKNDMKRRNKDRQDDESRWHKIKFARKFIYEKGLKVTGAAVKRVLASESLAPNKVSNIFYFCYLPSLTHSQNAFSEKLSSFGFNLFMMLVVDLLHEFELGVWKAIFSHLIRILVAYGNNTVQELNRR